MSTGHTLQLTLLGTGSSGGVPRVGGDWGVCDPKEIKNRRRRCCALFDLFKTDCPDIKTRALIDTSPDLREQLLDANVQDLDALIYTHDHADQTHGIDDIRALFLRNKRRIPVYADKVTRESLNRRFAYIFEGVGGYPSILEQQSDIVPGSQFTISGQGGDIEFLPLDQAHGRIRSLGFRVGDIAYCNDLNDLPQKSLDGLRNLETLVVDALRYTPHPSHANLEQALDWIDELQPQRAVLTNLHIDMDYQSLCRELPEKVTPGYDGMVIEHLL